MGLIHFQDPESATFEGIVALGGSLSTANLMRAYRRGIFPWPMNEYLLPWCCPEESAILEFHDLYIPRSLAKVKRQNPFRFTIDQAFADVIAACAKITRTGETGTWITTEMMRAYCELHRKDMRTASRPGKGTRSSAGSTASTLVEHFPARACSIVDRMRQGWPCSSWLNTSRKEVWIGLTFR